MKHHADALWPHSTDRTTSVDVNNKLHFGISREPSNALEVLFRLPLTTICGGSCVGNNTKVSVSVDSLGMYIGISDSIKTMVGQASIGNGNFQLIYGVDHGAFITPNDKGTQGSNVFDTSNQVLSISGFPFGKCSSLIAVDNAYQTAYWNNSDQFGLNVYDTSIRDGNPSIDLILVGTQPSVEYVVTAVCVETESASIPHNDVMPVSLHCGLDAPTSFPTSLPTTPTSTPSAMPSAEPALLYTDTTVITPVLTLCISGCGILYGLLFLWHYCLSDRETDRDAHVLDAEEHVKQFFNRIILNRRDYYIQHSWIVVWWKKCLDHHGVLGLFSYAGKRGRSSLLLKLTLFIFETLTFVSVTMCLYYLVFPDTGECERIRGNLAEERCGLIESGLGTPMCYWKPSDFTCHYNPPLVSYYFAHSRNDIDWVERINLLQEKNSAINLYASDMLSDFNTMLFLCCICLVVIALSRAISITFERLLREKVFNSYLSWHKYARQHVYRHKKGNLNNGDDTESDSDVDDTMFARASAYVHNTMVTPVVTSFKTRMPNVRTLDDAVALFTGRKPIRLQKRRAAVVGVNPNETAPGSHEVYKPSPLTPARSEISLDVRSGENLNSISVPSPGSPPVKRSVKTGAGVSWKQQLEEHHEIQKHATALQRVDTLRKPHVPVLSPSSPSVSVRSSAAIANKNDVNGGKKFIRTQNSSLSLRTNTEAYAKPTDHLRGHSEGYHDRIPSNELEDVESMVQRQDPGTDADKLGKLGWNYIGNSKYWQFLWEHRRYEKRRDETPEEEQQRLQLEKEERKKRKERQLSTRLAAELDGLYSYLIDQYKEFRENRPNGGSGGRFWSIADSPQAAKGGGLESGQSESGIKGRRSKALTRKKAVSGNSDRNNMFYSVSDEYEDLMSQAKELVTRPRLTEESATTVAYCKYMLGLNDDGECINGAIATNHNNNSMWYCMCALVSCFVGANYYPYYYNYSPDDIANNAPSSGSVLRSIQFSRVDSKRVFHRLYGLNNTLKNMLLLENFILSEYPLTRFAQAKGCYIYGLDSKPPSVVSLFEYLLWVILSVGILFMGQLWWVYSHSTNLSYHSNALDVAIVASSALVVYHLGVSPLFIYLHHVVVAGALDLELSYIHTQIRNRARTVFERKYGFFGRDLYHGTQGRTTGTSFSAIKTNQSSRKGLHNICCITDHFNPACRVAKAYTGLVVFRLVLELNDYDLNRHMFYILPRRVDLGLESGSKEASGTKISPTELSRTTSYYEALSGAVDALTQSYKARNTRASDKVVPVLDAAVEQDSQVSEESPDVETGKDLGILENDVALGQNTDPDGDDNVGWSGDPDTDTNKCAALYSGCVSCFRTIGSYVEFCLAWCAWFIRTSWCFLADSLSSCVNAILMFRAFATFTTLSNQDRSEDHSSLYVPSLCFGEGNIEWDSKLDRFQHAASLVIARYTLEIPVIGIAAWVTDIGISFVLLGCGVLLWYIYIGSGSGSLIRDITTIGVPCIVGIFFIRSERRRRNYNNDPKHVADALSSYDNTYQRIVDYLSKLDDLQGNAAEALLSQELMDAHSDGRDEIVNSNENNRLSGRRGALSDSLNFKSSNSNKLHSQKFAGATYNYEGGLGLGTAGYEDAGTLGKEMMRAMASGYDDPQSDSESESESGQGEDFAMENNNDTHLRFSLSGTHGSRKDLVTKESGSNLNAPPNTKTSAPHAKSSYMMAKPSPAKRTKKDKQEADVQDYMDQLSKISKQTVRAYLKSNNVHSKSVPKSQQKWKKPNSVPQTVSE